MMPELSVHIFRERYIYKLQNNHKKIRELKFLNLNNELFLFEFMDDKVRMTYKHNKVLSCRAPLACWGRGYNKLVC